MKKILTWIVFIVIVGLIIWGLIAASNKAGQGFQSINLPTPVTASDWITCSTTSPVTIVEYSDFQCPACEAYQTQILKKFLKEEGNKVRFVYRHFPLPQHQNAYGSLMASEAAGRQGKFWEMHDVIFDHQSEWEGLATSSAEQIFAGYAKALGVDMKAYAKDVVDPIVHARIASSTDAASFAGIYGTPTFFVNGKSIQNPRGYDDFKAAVEKSL